MGRIKNKNVDSLKKKKNLSLYYAHGSKKICLKLGFELD